ncbi:MAG: MoaD/ThiS family protein [Dehalococcoidales bacterium]|jgi:molybdopterin converting factor small subunit|nr:MoaD/ThiS family protein [Dehalococcoidales bacterium]MDP7109929.1 MoaD/ThiS family protein [Dehalococcoidales bacterium]MDP7309725.1 MoaD/ThiS family protein [Dehalococcoidales bacterium]MDP7409342.1 MoaD/ThiS family protein [Dehalococcoidales bacterium]MDP7675677.1 MoaD/ThiS family protein [Dehalococcoidales bacterium]|tara:strand:+ start:762 stop:1034 length:273 start_codon:yes stop_codon:yes gene_type:complete
MGVKINIAPYLQPYTGNNVVVEVNGGQVGECLEQLVKQFPGMGKMLYLENGELFPHVAIFVNSADVYPEGLAKFVKEGDEVHIIYIIAGG